MPIFHEYFPSAFVPSVAFLPGLSRFEYPAVLQFIEEKTGGRLSLGAGTLYGALNSMQEKGWIELFGDSEGRKKEYLITVKGKEIAEKELIRLRELVGIASGIVGGTL